MSSEYFLTYDCDCGHTIKHRCLDFSNDIPTIPYEFMGQQHFDCEECGRSHMSGDIDMLTDDSNMFMEEEDG